MKVVEKTESGQSANNGEHVEDDPLMNRHDVQEWVWECSIDRRGVFDPCRVNQSERCGEESGSFS